MSGDALLIRSATEADIGNVRALLRETWHQVYDPIIGRDAVDEVSARWHAPALLARQLHKPRSSFLVACDRDHLVAHGFAYMREPMTLVVSRLYVRPSHQRQGIGRRILASLSTRHAEAQTLRLFVAAENARGVSFWRREGFIVVGEGMEEGARVLHMELHLR
jgi:ribosomal protein S18 acetylase RimI-like enzyme